MMNSPARILFWFAIAVVPLSAKADDGGLGTYLSTQDQSAPLGGSTDGTVKDRIFTTVLDYAYPSMASRWTINPVAVCWENVSSADEGLRALVRQAIADSWSRYARIDFTYWGPCAENSQGIRILIEDSGPHTLGLGTAIDGKVDGMLLNFAFRNWSPSCGETDEKRRFCVYTIAVHEFGHAIGFAHEQNRGDTPFDECFNKRQGSGGDTYLTPWDPESVMNYCNPRWNNNGKLSSLDIFAVRKIYGER
jgi:hypothetical protein